MTPGASDLLRLETWNALKGAAWAMFRKISEEMERSDLTKAQHGLLHVLLREAEPLTPQEIARRCDVTPATVTGILNKLEDGGFVERLRVSPDRRVVHVRVTKKGEASMHEWRETFQRHLGEVMSPLSEGEMRTLVALLTRIAPPVEGPPGGFGALIRHDAAGGPPKRAAAKRRKKR